MRVIIRGNWAPYVGTDYCYALGTFDSLDDPDALACAEDVGWSNWEPEEDDDGIEDEGPEYCLEEYDPEVHDMHRAGGGSFKAEFEEMENGV